MILVFALTMAVTASAQFEEGKIYVNTSLTGLDMSYSGMEKARLGLQVQGGYMLMDNIMALGSLSIDHSDISDKITVGAGGRYYILQNGIYLGANIKAVHGDGGYNDLLPGVEVGYAFFLNRNFTIEPAIYYDQSFKSHSDYSKIGLRIGFGYYF